EPAMVPAGGYFRFTVTAFDQFNNRTPAYGGTVTFASSDSAASLPSDGTLVSGVGTFSAALNSPGYQTLSLADAVSSSVSGNSKPLVVTGAANRFVLNSPSAATAGSAFGITITALDANNFPALGYVGTVVFSGSDAASSLPAAATL